MRLSVRTVRPASIRSLTGVSDKQLGELISRLWASRPDRRRGRRWALSFPDRVLLCVFGYRTNLTFEQLAALFDISDTTAHRVVADLTPHLAALLGPPPTDRRELWIVDGTLIPVRDRSRTGKSKNYRRSVNVQVVSRYRDRRICAVGNAWPGNRNDSVVYRDTVMDVCVGHGRVIGDGGYRYRFHANQWTAQTDFDQLEATVRAAAWARGRAFLPE